MKIELDRDDDVLYLELDGADVVDSQEISPGIVVDFDANDRVLGIEILNASKKIAGGNLERVDFAVAGRRARF